MLQIPPCRNTVPGFAVEMARVEDNLAKSGYGDEHLHDEYLQIAIFCDVSYGAVFGKGYWDFRLVRLRTPIQSEIECHGRSPVFVLQPDDCLQQVQLCEYSTSDQLRDVWLFIEFTRPAKHDRQAFSIRLLTPVLQS